MKYQQYIATEVTYSRWWKSSVSVKEALVKPQSIKVRGGITDRTTDRDTNQLHSAHTNRWQGQLSLC